jgi:hypothetical protein
MPHACMIPLPFTKYGFQPLLQSVSDSTILSLLFQLFLNMFSHRLFPPSFMQWSRL